MTSFLGIDIGTSSVKAVLVDERQTILAEASAPNPMIAKWGTDIPYVYAKGNCRYWQP